MFKFMKILFGHVQLLLEFLSLEGFEEESAVSAWQLMLLMLRSRDHGEEVLVTEVGRILLFSIEVFDRAFEEEVNFSDTRGLVGGVVKLTSRVLVETWPDLMIFEDFDFRSFLLSAFREVISDLVCLTVSARLSLFCSSL